MQKIRIKPQNITYLSESKQISYFCCSLQFTMQNRETCYLKKSVLIQIYQREILCAWQVLVPTLSQIVRPEENSSYFSNIQPSTITCIQDAFIK